MKIALLGYGKMGKEVEQIAISEGHTIICKLGKNKSADDIKMLKSADVAIEFSNPDSAYENVLLCFSLNIPVVSGSTGWKENLEHAKAKCINENLSFFYASNFSIGMHTMKKTSELLAALMSNNKDYKLVIEEIHHLEKKDYPSGSAITLAETIINNSEKSEWKVEMDAMPINISEQTIPIISKRENNVPGTHIVKYQSEIDTIELKHTAHNRKGFALGAIRAASWLIGKKGYFEMNDLIQINQIQ